MSLTPVLGVGAVIVKDQSLLLVKRAQEPFRDYWSIPGGKVHWGESLHDALIREIDEETGLNIAMGELCYHFEYINQDEQQHFVVLDFYAQYLSGELVAGDDASDACWVPLSEIRTKKINPMTMDALKKLFPDEIT